MDPTPFQGDDEFPQFNVLPSWNWVKLAEGLGIRGAFVDTHQKLDDTITEFLNNPHPLLVAVKIPKKGLPKAVKDNLPPKGEVPPLVQSVEGAAFKASVKSLLQSPSTMGEAQGGEEKEMEKMKGGEEEDEERKEKPNVSKPYDLSEEVSGLDDWAYDTGLRPIRKGNELVNTPDCNLWWCNKVNFIPNQKGEYT